MKKVAAIIVTFNGEKYIEKCLKTLFQSTFPCDIFVADNCSTDNTIPILESYSDKIHFYNVGSNSGFGFANNLLLKEALKKDYDYFFLVNQDLYAEPDALEKLVRFSDKNSEFGIVAPIQYDGKGDQIDFNFKEYISHSKDSGTYYETSFCNAAAWLITNECLQKVGLFHPLFRHYGEDRNYCERVTFHDLKIAIVKDAKVLHDRMQSTSLEKAINLAEIKLLTLFLNPSFTRKESRKKAFINVFGISKYLFKKYKSIAPLSALYREYNRLSSDQNMLEQEKNSSKQNWNKN